VETKKFEGPKFFLTKFASAWAPALGKRNYAESQANALGNVSPLPSASWRHSAKSELCRVPGGGTRQSLNAVSPTDGQRACWARAQALPIAAWPALGKGDALPSAVIC